MIIEDMNNFMRDFFSQEDNAGRSTPAKWVMGIAARTALSAARKRAAEGNQYMDPDNFAGFTINLTHDFHGFTLEYE